MKMNITKFKSNILSACKTLKESDSELFDLEHHEETINHRLALYLMLLFKDHDVDVEYSLNERDPKTNKRGKRVRPDIVIHKRGNNDCNLAVIEVKRFNNGSSDLTKIENYSNLKYQYGVRVKLQKDGSLNCALSKIYEFRSEEWIAIEGA